MQKSLRIENSQFSTSMIKWAAEVVQPEDKKYLQFFILKKTATWQFQTSEDKRN